MDRQREEILERLLEECKKAIEESGTGHLPLPYRVRLLKTIGDKNLVNKIFYECAKKISLLLSDEKNIELFDLLYAVERFLYQNEGKELEIESLADKCKNIVEKYDGIEILAGYTQVSLGYSAAYDAEQMLDIEKYDGQSDDDAFEWEEWNPDFFASMAYAGGNPFVNEGNEEKRREFWLWYTDTVKTLSHHPEQPVIDIRELIKKKNKTLSDTGNLSLIPERKQTYRTKELLEKIEKVLFNTLADLQKQEGNVPFKFLIIEGDCLDEGIDQNAYFVLPDGTEKDIELNNYLFGDERSSAVLMDQIKTEMYLQAKEEGAWVSYKIILDRQSGKYYVDFNYDDFNRVSDIRQDAETFINEIEVFPRDKAYLPSWWRKLLE